MRFVFGSGRPVGFIALTLGAAARFDESLACLAWLIHRRFGNVRKVALKGVMQTQFPESFISSI